MKMKYLKTRKNIYLPLKMGSQESERVCSSFFSLFLFLIRDWSPKGAEPACGNNTILLWLLSYSSNSFIPCVVPFTIFFFSFLVTLYLRSLNNNEIKYWTILFNVKKKIVCLNFDKFNYNLHFLIKSFTNSWLRVKTLFGKIYLWVESVD